MAACRIAIDLLCNEREHCQPDFREAYFQPRIAKHCTIFASELDAWNWMFGSTIAYLERILGAPCDRQGGASRPATTHPADRSANSPTGTNRSRYSICRLDQETLSAKRPAH